MNMSVKEKPEAAMYPGMILRYRVSPILGIPLNWTSEITAVKEEKYFIDSMLEGPFKIWHHQHRFEEQNGGTLIIDDLHYKLPFEPISKIAHPFTVKKQMRAMFEHRKNVLKDLLS